MSPPFQVIIKYLKISNDKKLFLKASVQCLGRDRAFRRYWMFESIPGIFVEHDDDQIGSCLDEPTPWNPEAGPLTEAEALERAKDILVRTCPLWL